MKKVTSGFDYWPQTDGETFQYNIFRTPALWFPDAMEIVEQSGAEYQGNMLISTSAYGVGSFASYCHHPTVPPTPIVLSSTQVNGLGVYRDNYYIGEQMNERGNVIYPPEPKLARELIPGAMFDVFSTVFVSETDRTVAIENFHSRYKTLRFASYPNAPDVVVTAIAEMNPDGSFGWVGNYYYQRGVGIVLQYGGIVEPDGVTLREAIKLFKNP